MELKDLQKLYPLAIERSREYIAKRINETISDVPEQFIEEIKNNVDSMLSSTLNNSPRTLIEMFDIEKIFIDVVVFYESDSDDEISFKYRILPRDRNKKVQNEGKFNYISKDRKEIEELAITDAFCILEKKIKKQNNDKKPEK